MTKNSPLSNALQYDVAIAGGGLAGLALAIQLRKKGYEVILFEKERYPFHKVCGEYISMESWSFLHELGIDLHALKVSSITHLQVTSENGKSLQQKLPLGGFGISRYLLDHTMAKRAVLLGVVLKEETKINDIQFDQGAFVIQATDHNYSARVVCASFGKRSNIDIKWKRPFTLARKNKLNNYIGVKYHVKAAFPEDTIALHTFSGGYCGIVKIEGDAYNLCYLTTAANLVACNGDIGEMEDSILSRNPHLAAIFSTSRPLYDAPLTISQISFDKKSQVENHVLMIGDAAGMITPLCGNGMSMALHGSKIASAEIGLFLQDKTTMDEMERRYSEKWQELFGKRLATGRRMQRLFGNRYLTNLVITIGKWIPQITRYLIRQTHGRPF